MSYLVNIFGLLVVRRQSKDVLEMRERLEIKMKYNANKKLFIQFKALSSYIDLKKKYIFPSNISKPNKCLNKTTNLVH